MTREVWTIDELAKHWKVKKGWVYQHMAELPHYKVGGQVRFDPEELEVHFRKRNGNAGNGNGNVTDSART